MDRIISSKWFFYAVIGCAVGYLWVNPEWLSNALRTLSIDWWRWSAGRFFGHKEESPARWAPVATGAQGKSRDTRSASLALGRGPCTRSEKTAGVTPALSVKARWHGARVKTARRWRAHLHPSRKIESLDVWPAEYFGIATENFSGVCT